MENFMGLFTAGPAQIFLIHLLYQRVVVALPQGHALVLVVEGPGPQPLQVGEVADVRRLGGLSAAVDAPAGAGHDLDKIVVLLSGLHRVQHLRGVFDSADAAHPDQRPADFVFRLLDAFVCPADGLEHRVGQLLAGEGLCRGAQSGLHHPAGDAEQMPRAAGNAQGRVKFLVGHLLEEQAGPLDHVAQGPGGQGDVHIRDALPGGALVIPLVLEFLGRAGHDGDADDIPGVQPLLFGIVGLGQGAEDLLGALAGGQVGQKFRIELLAVLHPAGTTAGDDGQVLPGFQPLHELGGLLHDGHVGGKVGIEYPVEAQAAQGGGHFALHIGADGHTERLTQGGPDTGGGLDNDVLLGVVDGGPDGVGLHHGSDGPGGTGYDALAAVDAGALPQGDVKAGAHMSLKAPLGNCDGAHPHHLLAGGHTPAAEDALAVVADEVGGAGVDLIVVFLPLESHIVVHAVFPAQPLELALAAAGTAEALLVVDGQQQLQVGSAGGLDPFGVGEHLHSLGNGIDTGGDQVLSPLHLHHAHAAGPDLVDAFEIAQGWDGNTGGVGRLQDGGAGGGAAGDIVDFQIDHIHGLQI